MPTQLVATPNPVKNGAELTITGKDMDLITGIAFPNAATSELNKVETTKVTATVPEDAQESTKDGQWHHPESRQRQDCNSSLYIG